MMNNRANHASALSVAITIAVFAVPQFLFFWLAPDSLCRMVVYGVMTGYTLAHLLFCLFLWGRNSIRIAVAPVHLSTCFVIIELLVCAVLLAFNATKSTAAFLLVILGLVHFLALAILYKTLEQ